MQGSQTHFCVWIQHGTSGPNSWSFHLLLNICWIRIRTDSWKGWARIWFCAQAYWTVKILWHFMSAPAGSGPGGSLIDKDILKRSKLFLTMTVPMPTIAYKLQLSMEMRDELWLCSFGKIWDMSDFDKIDFIFVWFSWLVNPVIVFLVLCLWNLSIKKKCRWRPNLCSLIVRQLALKFLKFEFCILPFTETNCLSQLLPTEIFKAPLNYYLHAVWRDQLPFSFIFFQYKSIVNQSTLDFICVGLTVVWSVAPISLSQMLFSNIN